VAAASLQAAISEKDDLRIAVEARILVSQVDAAQLQLFDAISDWDDVHPEALREVRDGYSERLEGAATRPGRSDQT
jgi:SHS2 domain-containing protein